MLTTYKTFSNVMALHHHNSCSLSIPPTRSHVKQNPVNNKNLEWFVAPFCIELPKIVSDVLLPSMLTKIHQAIQMNV
jgi:hypothetical protein